MSSQPADVQATPGQPIVFELIPTSTAAEGPIVLTGADFGDQKGTIYLSCPRSMADDYEAGDKSNVPAEIPESNIVDWRNDRIILNGLEDHPGSREDEHEERLLVYKNGNDQHPPANTSVTGGANFGAWIRVVSLSGSGGYRPPYGH